METVKDLRIVLVDVRNPLNIGAAARAMANFGCHDLALVNPYLTAWEEVKSARAGLQVLERAQVFPTLAEALVGCQTVIGTTAGSHRAPSLPLESWSDAAHALPPGGTALLFGSEKFGLSVSDLAHCHRLVRIPTDADAPSMNLGQAVAICCYELQRSSTTPGLTSGSAPGPAAADAAQLVRLAEAWRPMLEELGVLQPQHRASQTRRLLQMLLRWRPTPGDTDFLLGILRQIHHAMQRANNEK